MQDNFLEELRNSLNEKLGTETFNPKLAYRTSLMDLDAKIEHPPVVISKGEHRVGDNYYPTVLGSEGAFSVIVGAPKTRKSFFKSGIIASYFGGQANYYFEDMRGHHNGNKLCLSFDTEQSDFHAQRVNHRIIKMIGEKPKNFKSFALQSYSPKERLAIIEHAILESPDSDNLGLVVVDGVADLLDNVNDIEKSNDLITKILKWVNVSQCHMIFVIHRNTSQLNARATGHIGSALMKKAETVFTLEAKEQMTEVNAGHCRNYPFDRFAFSIFDGLPKQTDNLEDIF